MIGKNVTKKSWLKKANKFTCKIYYEVEEDKEVKDFIEFVVRNVSVPSEINEIEQWGNNLLSKLRKG